MPPVPYRCPVCRAGEDGARPWLGTARGHVCPCPSLSLVLRLQSQMLLLEKFILPLYGEILFVVNSSVLNLEFL